MPRSDSPINLISFNDIPTVRNSTLTSSEPSLSDTKTVNHLLDDDPDVELRRFAAQRNLEWSDAHRVARFAKKMG